jgi:GxxExxY protein
MNANGRELILKKDVFAVVGCAMEVLNTLGHGLHEKVYENAMCVEFRLRTSRTLSRSDIASSTKAKS